MYDFYIWLLINWSWILISWDDSIHPLYWFTYLKSLISNALKVIHSSFVTNVWISSTLRVSSHLFTYPHLWISNSLLSMMKASLALVIRLSLTYPHVSDKAQMNNHQASYLVSICLIYSFQWASPVAINCDNEVNKLPLNIIVRNLIITIKLYLKVH